MVSTGGPEYWTGVPDVDHLTFEQVWHYLRAFAPDVWGDGWRAIVLVRAPGGGETAHRLEPRTLERLRELAPTVRSVSEIRYYPILVPSPGEHMLRIHPNVATPSGDYGAVFREILRVAGLPHAFGLETDELAARFVLDAGTERERSIDICPLTLETFRTAIPHPEAVSWVFVRRHP